MYRIGSLKNTDAEYYTQVSYTWSDPPIHTLGILVTTDRKEMQAINIVPVIKKIRQTLATWSTRDLTLTGRVLVINTLVESLFVYRLSVLPWVDEEYLMMIQREILSFVWHGKKSQNKL